MAACVSEFIYFYFRDCNQKIVNWFLLKKKINNDDYGLVWFGLVWWWSNNNNKWIISGMIIMKINKFGIQNQINNPKKTFFWPEEKNKILVPPTRKIGSW